MSLMEMRQLLGLGAKPEHCVEKIEEKEVIMEEILNSTQQIREESGMPCIE